MKQPEPMNNLWMISGLVIPVWIAHSLQLSTRRFAPIYLDVNPLIARAISELSRIGQPPISC
jgi:hypothetical protein